MNLKLRITNNNKVSKVVSLLQTYAEIPLDVTIECLNKGISYHQILGYITAKPNLIKFISSTNNRQLFFLGHNAFGNTLGLKPNLWINEKEEVCEMPLKTVKVYDEEFDFDEDEDNVSNNSKSYHYEEVPLYSWNPKKWNIADTHETTLWIFSNVVALNIKRKQVFEIEFIFLDTKFTPPTQIIKP